MESLIGQPLDDGDVVVISKLVKEPGYDRAERDAAWEELESIVGQMQARTAQSGLSPNQIDELIDAECAAARKERRSSGR